MTNTTREAFTLNYSIEIDGIETDTLQLRRVTIGDLEATENEKSDRRKTIRLLSRISGVPENSIKKMDVTDFDRATIKVMDFLGVNSGRPEDS